MEAGHVLSISYFLWWAFLNDKPDMISLVDMIHVGESFFPLSILIIKHKMPNFMIVCAYGGVKMVRIAIKHFNPDINNIVYGIHLVHDQSNIDMLKILYYTQRKIRDDNLLVNVCACNDMSMFNDMLNYLSKKKYFHSMIDRVKTKMFKISCNNDNLDMAMQIQTKFVIGKKTLIDCFYYACSHGNLKIAKWLCGKTAFGYHTVARDDSIKAFRKAVKSKNFEMIKFIFFNCDARKYLNWPDGINLFKQVCRWGYTSDQLQTVQWMISHFRLEKIDLIDNDIFHICCSNMSLMMWICTEYGIIVDGNVKWSTVFPFQPDVTEYTAEQCSQFISVLKWASDLSVNLNMEILIGLRGGNIKIAELVHKRGESLKEVYNIVESILNEETAKIFLSNMIKCNSNFDDIEWFISHTRLNMKIPKDAHAELQTYCVHTEMQTYWFQKVDTYWFRKVIVSLCNDGNLKMLQWLYSHYDIGGISHMTESLLNCNDFCIDDTDEQSFFEMLINGEYDKLCARIEIVKWLNI